MRLAKSSAGQVLPEFGPKWRPNGRSRRLVGAGSSPSWRLLLVAGVAGFALQLPVQAKPIAGCLVQEADLLDPTLCLSPPKRLTATRPTSQTLFPAGSDIQRDQVARVTLDNIDSGAGSTSGANASQPNLGKCAALRGTHEAQSLMLQTIQRQLQTVDRDRRLAKSRLQALRRSGADEAQLSSSAARVSQFNAVWSALKDDVKKRTRSFNKSMSSLTNACLRG